MQYVKFYQGGNTMSKLYSSYLSMKKLDKDTILLFKSGIFYILLDNDARLVSSILNLKLTQLNSDIVKCGFPINSLDKYLNLLIKYKLNVKIVDLNSNTSYKPNEFIYDNNTDSLLLELSNLNVNNLSIKEAYSKLEDFNQKANNILNSKNK